ncbi:MAG: signal transduction histidine kinase [Clostridiaceae bacterium]|jgi:signal transduction histidine kinase|nr:signal transduction histidine kinase [Clostridiaceae bacterium]
MGAIAIRVIDKNPDMEKEIMPMITKEISSEEASRGKSLLDEYGINRNLDGSIFPYINVTIKRSDFEILFVFIVMAATLLFLNYFQFGFFYDRIRRLTVGANKVVEGDYDISIGENREGDFSKLANSFNSMRETIRNNINELKEEKQFLIDLLSDISHQLKTPISSMIVYNDIMLNQQLSDQQRRTFLLNDKSQLYRMSWLIKNILKLAKLDARAIEFNKESQSLAETIEDSMDALSSKALEQKVHIIFNGKKDVFFSHDRLWMEEALNNIIKNGIEHTDSGGQIHIKLDENPIYRRIIIEDTGEGISEEDLPNIFKRFYKAKTAKKSDSIGIGLALAKSIIEFHNGIIEVQSKLSEGTKFIITFLKY